MKTFNVIRLESGKIRKTIVANSYDEAVEKASDLLNCYIHDEHFLEEAKTTEKFRELQRRVIA